MTAKRQAIRLTERPVLAATRLWEPENSARTSQGNVRQRQAAKK
jgi:hypothetical protein